MIGFGRSFYSACGGALMCGHTEVLFGLVILLVLSAPGLTRAQSVGDSDSVAATDLKRVFREGLTAYRNQQYERAETNLRLVLRENSSVELESAPGSVAYWLGRVYDDQRQPVLARKVWSAGVRRSIERGEFDVHAGNSYIRSIYRDSVASKFDVAAQLLLRLLENADEPLSEREREVVRQHLSEMVFLLPDPLRRQAVKGDGSTLRVHRAENGGHALAAWWRSRDTKPATSKNERVIEHLRRVEYARRHYASNRTPAGFDDRGRVYVRLGSPVRTGSVDFDSQEFLEVLRRIDKSMGNNLAVDLSSFPENEFWLYERGEKSYPYLFVHDGNAYRIGGVVDLVPSRFRTAMKGRTGRGGAKIDVVLEAMRTAYRQLATYHMEYGPGYNRLSAYLNSVEGARISHKLETGTELSTPGNRSDNSALIQQGGTPRGVVEQPSQKVEAVVSFAKREEAQLSHWRKENVPRQETETLDGVASLPVAVRVARFLERDGTTSTRVYWGLSRRDLEDTEAGALTSGRRLISLTARHMTEEYRVRAFDSKQYFLRSFEEMSDIVVADEQLQVGGDTSTYHLGLQWNQYTVESSSEEKIRPERLVRSGIVRADSLRPLTAAGGTLEMSDLVPALHQSSRPVASLDRKMEQPYPFRQLSEGTQLALYFEVYDLRRDQRGTRYTVEYNVRQRTEQNRLEMLFQGTEEKQTSVSTTREGQRRRLREYIVIDPENWTVDGDAQVYVTVTVRDEKTGQEVSRDAQFRVISESG